MLLLLLACTPTNETKKEDSSKEVVADDSGQVADGTTTFSGNTGRDGTLQIPVHIEKDNSVVQISVTRPDGGLLSTEYFYDTDGTALLSWEDWYDSPYSLTDAIYVYDDLTTVNWPVRLEDGLLKKGDYILSVATVKQNYNYQGDVPVEATIMQRQEEDTGRGTQKIVVAYATGLAEDPVVSTAVEAGGERWKELYAAAGVSLEVRYTSIDVDPALPDSAPGQDGYKSFYEGLTEKEVVVVIGDLIANDRWLYGEAGGVPGALVPSNRSVVGVSWIACAGPDGEFSAGDQEMLAETMAHEVGHYLGLYHPVEDGYDYWDALSDTVECKSQSACEEKLGKNVMFPYPICETQTRCDQQTELSEEQAGVMNLYLGVE
ncbi:MAG TPA: hypothetical protein PLA94_14455 [Myxococcota bacterium]|nr:hypothetical protein [Myxococcota bacterium]